MTNQIPPIANPLDEHWSQPDSDEILIDSSVAMMTEINLNKLKDCTGSPPYPPIAGKMWRTKWQGKWWLWWYSKPDLSGNHIAHRRPITLI